MESQVEQTPTGVDVIANCHEEILIEEQRVSKSVKASKSKAVNTFVTVLLQEPEENGGKDQDCLDYTLSTSSNDVDESISDAKSNGNENGDFTLGENGVAFIEDLPGSHSNNSNSVVQEQEMESDVDTMLNGEKSYIGAGLGLELEEVDAEVQVEVVEVELEMDSTGMETLSNGDSNSNPDINLSLRHSHTATKVRSSVNYSHSTEAEVGSSVSQNTDLISEEIATGTQKKTTFSEEKGLKSESDENQSDDESYSRLDRYGFLTGDNSNTARHASMSAVSLARNRQSLSTAHETDRHRMRRIRLENLRVEKWLKMSKDFKYEMTSRPTRFKRRIRKGIPDSFRQKVWPIVCGAKNEQEANPNFYKSLLYKACTSSDPALEKVHESIYRDVGRTFPRHVIFKHKLGLGQKSLANVLRAYSVLDTEVGYCQGMGFVVGLLLGYLREEDTFWILKTLMLNPPWDLAQLYKPGMPGSQLLLFQFECLLKHFVPDVASHLEKENIVPSMYATQWFITVFAYNFPFDIVVRIWDVFLYEGWKIVFRVAITIIKEHRKEILARDFEKILEYFRGIPPTLEAESLLTQSFKLKLKTAQLKSIEKKFELQ